MNKGPLADIRILELGHVIAGPLAATLLGDFGADIIKVEIPGTADMVRDLGPKSADGVGVWWKTLGRNKRLLALDWKTPQGRELLLELVRDVDVLVENFRPGVIERAGLSPEVLMAANPALVVLRISGYGQSGPFSSIPAFGRAAEALSGLPHLTGFPDGPPMHPGFPVADTTTGLMGALAIMIALHEARAGSGQGQVIDLSVFETLLRLMDYPVPTVTGARRSPARNGLRQPLDFAPGGVFQTRDGIWVTVTAGNTATAHNMLRAVGGREMADDPRFSSLEGIAEHMQEVFERMKAFVESQDYDVVLQRFVDEGAVAARIHTIEEIIDHPQIRHRQNIVAVGDEPTKVVGPVPHLTRTPGSIRWLGKPEVGVDSLSVLREIGIDEQRIADLVRSGIVSSPASMQRG